MRLFIAIEFPDDIKAALGQLRVDIPGARWVATEQIHLTLAFLGEVEDAAVEPLTRALAHVRIPEFRLRFGGAGCFPSRQRPRVLWAGLQPEPRLNDLVDRIRSTVLACTIPQEERRFSPHITLARLKLEPSPVFDGFLERHRQLRLPSFLVTEFVLYQSHLTAQGAMHIPIKRFLLTAACAGNAL